MNDKLKRTQVQIQSDQLAWLKHHAFRRNLSMSQVVRECIGFYRSHLEKTRQMDLKKEKALTIVGSFSSSDSSGAK